MIRMTVFLGTLLVSNTLLAGSYYQYKNASGGILFTNKAAGLGGDWKLIEHRKIKTRSDDSDTKSRTFSYNRTAVSSTGTLGFMHYGERERLNTHRDSSCGAAKVSHDTRGLTTISIRSCEPKTSTWPTSNPYRASRSAKKAQFNELIAQAAQRHQVDERLVHAVIQTESAYNANAISSAGAVGLMQLMPGTARQYGVTDRNDPSQNINGGTKYLRYLLDLFNSNMDLAVAAYNAGENAVMKHHNSIPPYPETRNYVRQVLSLYNR
ncbi:Putative murein lytic transglycosylase YjbJ (modular protein) [Crenothrix polyspora]|uniref:Putative murein lytic transglycosylase YjbJ (Modular protein) n=1 Tax=Crenothrix polyspora TaxID=360316 RepID=A0A1R4HGV2_9GAMM|nr:lytic transglycosylase domain-containing protein [Crenothrix polyspora]SJM95462.1 Putative murein lytic transglycosylase YjbJ (modular protein) [Crenothrix polyspora]